MNERGSRTTIVKTVLCPGCPFRATCAQFREQMDACYDALLLLNEEGEDRPASFSEFMALEDEED